MKTRLIQKIMLISLVFVAGCKSGEKSSSEDTLTGSGPEVSEKPVVSGKPADVKPSGPAPAWAPDIRPQMLAVIEKLAGYGDKSVVTLSAAEARKNRTIKDAVDDLMKEYNIPFPVYNIDTAGKEIPVNGGKIHISIYSPKQGKGPFPMIVYFHAGGFVVANIEVYSASAKILADRLSAVVISVGYRLAPEHKFPTAHNDAYQAYLWAVKNAGSIKGNANRIALVGESAGGNLAVATAIRARDEGAKRPAGIVAIYPIAGSDTTTVSYIKYANAKPLSRALMVYFSKQYLNNPSEAQDPRNKLLIADLRGLPQTTIITDEIDPLHSEGIELAKKLQAAGVETSSRNYQGVTHEFFGFGSVIPEAKSAEDYVVGQLKKVF